MFKKNNKENLRPITSNIPKITQQNHNNTNSYQTNTSNMETSRSPKVSQLYQKIQYSIDYRTTNLQNNEQNNIVSIHQQKIKEKIRGYNKTPTITSSQDVQDSFNVWDDELQFDGNIIENYTQRYQQYGDILNNNICQDEIAENILKLLGMKHKMKNLGKIPFFHNESKVSTNNYFIPPQKMWKFNKKRSQNFTNTLQISNQNSQCSNSRLNSLEVQNLNKTNLRQVSSPDILRMKFKQQMIK